MKSNTIVFCKQFFVSSFKRVSFRWRITKQNTNKTVNNGLLLQQIRSFNLKTKTNWIGVFFQYVTIKYHSGAPRLAKCLGIIPIAIEICTIRLYLSRHCSKWYMNERKRRKKKGNGAQIPQPYGSPCRRDVFGLVSIWKYIYGNGVGLWFFFTLSSAICKSGQTI